MENARCLPMKILTGNLEVPTSWKPPLISLTSCVPFFLCYCLVPLLLCLMFAFAFFLFYFESPFSSLSFVSFTSCLADSQLVCSALSFSSSGYKSSCPPFYRVVFSPLSPSPWFSLPFAPTFMTLCSRLWVTAVKTLQTSCSKSNIFSRVVWTQKWWSLGFFVAFRSQTQSLVPFWLCYGLLLSDRPGLLGKPPPPSCVCLQLKQT